MLLKIQDYKLHSVIKYKIGLWTLLTRDSFEEYEILVGQDQKRNGVGFDLILSLRMRGLPREFSVSVVS